MSRFRHLIEKITNTQNTSNIQIKISAILLQGSKPIGNVYSNTERNYIKGYICPAIHAEVNAISNYFGKDIRYSDKYGWSIQKKVVKNLNILVIRKKNDESLGNARPCYKCTMMLKNIGVNKVYYSMDDEIYCEKVKDMISINVSSSWKQIETTNYDTIYDYYKSIMDKMPKVIKSINTEFFIQKIIKDISNCKYKVLNNILTIYMCGHIIGNITII